MAIQTLETFVATAGTLNPNQRVLLLDQATLLLEDIYVHLPLKRAMHAVDPVQRLRNLKARMAPLSEREFHNELISIFTELRDLHTNYILPTPFADKIAFLPFLVEEFFTGGQADPTANYLVTKMLAGFTHPSFVVGSQITHWSGVPMDRAIEVNAERQAGSNADARHARGLEAMTIRDLSQSAPPDEWWVDISYVTPAGAAEEIRLDWKVFAPDPSPNGVDPNNGAAPAARALGYDAATENRRRAKKVMFNPPAMAAEVAALSGADRGDDTSSSMPDVFSFKSVSTPSGDFGYLRIWTFMVNDANAFLTEAVRILALLPGDGLIVDVRGNGGGNLLCAEGMLQLFTPHRISPTLLSMIATPLTLAMCDSPLGRGADLTPWRDSLAQASETGAVYSQSLPILAEEAFNALGQRYQGPVVLITDALCYSATDMFAAGFRDNGLGPILGTAANTGAGGANVWTHDLFRQLFPGSAFGFKALPKKAAFRVAFRRTTRQGTAAGTPIEDLGIVPDKVHVMTKQDVLNGNKDLIGAAGKILNGQPVRQLLAEPGALTGDKLPLKLTTRGLDRVDIAVDGRPVSSVDAADGSKRIRVAVPSGAQRLELSGFAQGVLVVRSGHELG
jgi:hypothetical protein